MLLTSLPTDVLILVLQNIAVQELLALAETCRLLNLLVTEFGWAAYLRVNPRPSFSLKKTRRGSSPRTRVHYDYFADRSWIRTEFVARPLSRPWIGKKQPIMVISPSRLIVASGSDLISYKFCVSEDGEAPSVHYEGIYSFTSLHPRHSDITGITFIADGGLDQTLCVGFHDGTLQRVFLEFPAHDTKSFEAKCSVVVKLSDGDFMESLSSQQDALLSLTSSGSATLYNLRLPMLSPDTLALNARSWVSHLSLDSSGPYAAFGTSSKQPLKVHSITADGLSREPTAILHADAITDPPTSTSPSSAVYGISQAPPASPWGSSPEIIVSGWFDGRVRCYDLRSSTRISVPTGLPCPTSLRPVLTMIDPFQQEPIYSVSCGGGSASHIAAGSARHSVVSFWDIRASTNGWSVHAPGNDRSPVYSIVLESSRLFGATQSRPFVYDFGPGVHSGTYPILPEGRGIDGLKRKKGSNGIGYYVTKYPHYPLGLSTNGS